MDGKGLHSFEVGHQANSIASTPERYGTEKTNGFNSMMMIGGDYMSGYKPEHGIIERYDHGHNKEGHKERNFNQIWKLKYTSNGSLLYAACDGGKIKRFRHYPDGRHRYLGDFFCHKADIYDMDISPYDEFIVTASKDKAVGVMCLGPPNHGWTSHCELT